MFNPSIADFILNEYNKDTKKLIAIFKSLHSVKSLEQLVSLEKAEIISSNVLMEILKEIYPYALKHTKSYDYLIYISYLYRDDMDQKEEIISLLNNIIENPLPINEFSKFLKLLTKFKKELHVEYFDFLMEIIRNRYLEKDEIRELIEFLSYYKVEEEILLSIIKTEVEKYIEDEINDITNGIDLSLYIDFYNNYDGSGEFLDANVNEDAIKENIKDELVASIKDFNPNLIKKLKLYISDLVIQIDIDKMVDEYIKSNQYGPDDYSGYSGGFENHDNDIEDLFERS